MCMCDYVRLRQERHIQLTGSLTCLHVCMRMCMQSACLNEVLFIHTHTHSAVCDGGSWSCDGVLVRTGIFPLCPLPALSTQSAFPVRLLGLKASGRAGPSWVPQVPGSSRASDSHPLQFRSYSWASDTRPALSEEIQ